MIPVTLGASPDHRFDRPLGLLSDCLRRIERFLGAFARVLSKTGGGALDAPHRKSFRAATDHFSTAAPRHTQEEGDSLFPLMRRGADAEVRAAMAKLDALEPDHLDAEAAHTDVDRLCRRWLEVGALDDDGRQAPELLRALRDLCRCHIAVEGDDVFPLAGRVWCAGELLAVGQAMARRRGVSVGHVRLSQTSGPRVNQEDRL